MRRARAWWAVAAVGGAVAAACRSGQAAPESAPAPALAPVALMAHDTVPAGTVRGWVFGDEIWRAPRPLPGALVSFPDARREVRADSAGRFEVAGLPPGGRQRLEARAIGFRPTRGTVEVPRAAGALVRVTLEVQMLCLDACPPSPPPRATGRIEPLP